MHIFILCIGVFACSTAAIFIRCSSVHPIMLSAARLLIAVVGLLPLFLRDLRRQRTEGCTLTSLLLPSILPGILLAVHFVSWNIGIRMTTVANGSLIVNLVPVAMPFVLWVLIKEKLNRLETIATAIAMSGTGLLVALDFNLDQKYFLGDLLCFGSMIFLCFYMAISRFYRTSRSIWLYVVPLYAVAGISCLIVAIIWGLATDTPSALPQLYPAYEWIWLLCLGFIPTIIGHSILNFSMKNLRGQTVSIINLTQFIYSAILAWLIFNEIPHWSLYAASGLLLTGTLLIIINHKK